MQGNGQFDGGTWLARLFQKDSLQAAFFQRIVDAINTLGKNTAVSPVGKLAPPPPVDGISVKVSGEMAHVVLTHNQPIQKGINYFVEFDNNIGFTQPQVEHLGTARQRVLLLPTKTDGGTTQNYYFRAYAQYHGSDPSQPTVLGGAQKPTAVTMGGSTTLTLLPSAGSGTATGAGTQGGWGLGKVLERPAPGPKRVLA